MRVIVWLVPLAFWLILAVYLYFFVKRILGACLPAKMKRASRWIALACTAAVMLPTLDVWGIWIVVVLHVAGFGLATDIVNLLVRRLLLHGRDNGKWARRWDGIYRRGWIPILVSLAVLGYGGWNMAHVVQTGYEIEIDKEIRPEGYRIALLSDLHLGTTFGTDKLRQYAESISQARPDLVILCGDIVDEGTSLELIQEAMPILGSIESNFGVYYVYGNHDKATYTENPGFTPDQLAEELRQAGIEILVDEAVKIQDDFTLIGRQDRSMAWRTGRKSTDQLLENVDREDFLLLLDHQPCELEEVDQEGYDLLLSGHTHAGQIWPVGVIAGATGINAVNYGYERLDHLQVIVTSGIAGWGYPIRTQQHSEYVIIEVHGKRAP